MTGSSRLGFRPGKTYYNAVLATMYIAVFVVIAGLVIANVFLPILSSPSSSQPAETGADSVATSTPVNSDGDTVKPPSQETSRTSNSTTEAGSGNNPITSPTGDQLEQQYKDTVANNSNATIVSAEKRGDVFYVRYVPHNRSQQTILNETGTLLGAYGGSTEYWEVKRLHVTILDENRQPIATYHAKTQWLNQYQQGEITSAQVINRTLDTINETTSSANLPASN